MTNTDLPERARRIAALVSQRDEIQADIKDEYDAAKSAGFTVTALKKAIKVYMMDSAKRERHESEQLDFETYMNALEGLNRPRLKKIQEHGEKVVAAFSDALEKRRASE